MEERLGKAGPGEENFRPTPSGYFTEALYVIHLLFIFTGYTLAVNRRY
jgi:hypothetical protein